MKNSSPLNRRHFLASGAAALAALPLVSSTATAAPADKIISPASKRQILLSCKLGMIPKKLNGKGLTLVERLSMAGDAGMDGVDFDQAAEHTAAEARAAVQESGIFVHNAIDHAHWKKRLTSPDKAERAEGVANIAHCIRVSHAAGGNGVLIVIGHGKDGEAEVVEERCRKEIKSLIPLAASLGQPILFENVWNHMQYDHNEPPEQGPEKFINFVDSFNSPWVGMYYDIGNHWKYGRPGDWIRGFGHRCVKLDIKGFSRAESKFKDIGDGDLPWDEVRKGLSDINYTGWATAEVGGGDVTRLTKVRKQMEEAFGL
ncbi:sugar phosphate isomerase/epimerase [Verrucomicrobia bacterium]|nr:sugar phosphate isomerase/epimerase [Verrucomicrobiota bacterium]